MRILVFSWKDLRHPWAGGSEVNLHEQARRWVLMGHRVTIFTSRPRGAPRRDRIEGVDIFRAGWRVGSFLLAPFAYLLFLRGKADVVLDIINGIPFCAPLFSRKPVVALIHHVHRDMFVPELGPALGRVGIAIERYLVPLIYRRVPLICVSESTAGQVRAILHGGRRLDIRIVHNGIDGTTYAPGGRKSDEPTVLYLGRLKHYKNVPELIEMMPRVRLRVPGARLVVVGDGDAMAEVKATMAKFDAGGYVSLEGFVSERRKVDFYRSAWVTATASSVEGWGLTVVEANACGTPAVAFDVPGLNESIEDGVTGLLARDEAGFVEHVADILADEDLRNRLSSKALELSARFNWDDAARRTLAVLEEAAG